MRGVLSTLDGVVIVCGKAAHVCTGNKFNLTWMESSDMNIKVQLVSNPGAIQ